MSRHKCRFRFEIKIHIGFILKATDIRTLVSNAIGILKVYPTNTHAYPFTPLHTHVPPHTPEHTNTNPRTPTRAHSHTPVRTPDIPAHENVNRVNNFLSNQLLQLVLLKFDKVTQKQQRSKDQFFLNQTRKRRQQLIAMCTNNVQQLLI